MTQHQTFNKKERHTHTHTQVTSVMPYLPSTEFVGERGSSMLSLVAGRQRGPTFVYRVTQQMQVEHKRTCKL